jgi:hypothetical protein
MIWSALAVSWYFLSEASSGGQEMASVLFSAKKKINNIERKNQNKRYSNTSYIPCEYQKCGVM